MVFWGLSKVMAKALDYVKRSQLDQTQKYMLCIIAFIWYVQKSGGGKYEITLNGHKVSFLGRWEYSKIRLSWWYNYVTITH